MAYKTPGVYVEEVSLFPPSLVQVETAIPAFVGYTQKSITPDNKDLSETPIRIKSLVDFESLFGKAYSPETFDIITDEDNDYLVESIIPNKRFYLYDALRQFYDNGGGVCYIVSVGSFNNEVTFDQLKKGFDLLRKEDEPTLLLSPDAVALTDNTNNPDLTQFSELQKLALKQCSDLQNRFCILDILQGYLAEDASNSPISDFRNTIGVNSLNYGAAYYPWIVSSYNISLGLRKIRFFEKSDTDTQITDLSVFAKDNNEQNRLNVLTDSISQTNAVVDMGPDVSQSLLLSGGIGYLKSLLATYRTNLENGTAPKSNTTQYLNILSGLANSFHNADTSAIIGSGFRRDVDRFLQDTALTDAIRHLVEIEKNPATVANNLAGRPTVELLYSSITQQWFGGVAYDVIVADGTAFPESAQGSLAILDALNDTTNTLLQAYQNLLDAALFYETQAERALVSGEGFFQGVMEKLTLQMRTMPPSGAVAGIYATVDRTRGVWKAPANISINSVVGPAVKIDNRDQENLNVHTTGKSVNAIRTFTGRGNLVWGARTLAGNDNEWRYVSVRRFFIMVEESTKRATAPFVFENNDANTWVKVKSMIENFLTLQWRNGALQGAKPEDAFFVKVGLGETMTLEDVLEGRMIVEIGMAAVRPAEFIILRFSHKMQSGDQ